MTQRRIAQILSTTEASISHYLSGKRGSSITLGPPVLEAINRLADRICRGTISSDVLARHICHLCRAIRQSCAVCPAPTPQACNTCTRLKLR